ncbi:MAG: hypothetical protein NTY99_02135 [DPANN group archaeon]|nr:hypothetical protein [DPANN group archaeon]
MEKTKGFMPMPLSMKILFVLFLIGLIMSFFLLPTILTTGVSFFGMILTGVPGIIALLFVIALQLIFIISLWNRYPWAWKYGLAFMLYSVVNSILSMLTVPAKIEESFAQLAYIQGTTEAAKSVAVISAVAGTIFSIVIYSIFAYFIYRHRKYFEG